MNLLLIYMIKAAVYLSAFYLVYAIMLSRDTMYGRNRAFIITSVIIAFILPFITIQTSQPVNISFFGKILSDVFVQGTANASILTTPGKPGIKTMEIICAVYKTGIIVFGAKLLIDLLNLLVLIARRKNRDSHIIFFHRFNTAGFSALGHVFINTRLTAEETGEIIMHEQNHLNRNHFLDIIFLEIIKIFQWFNPTIYLFNRSLRAIHEYQADEGSLCTGIPLVEYQNLLLRQVFKTRVFSITNDFSNPSLIKKRMIMMTKKRTTAFASLKLLMVLPVIVVVLFAFSSFKETLNPVPIREEVAVAPPQSLPYPTTPEINIQSEVKTPQSSSRQAPNVTLQSEVASPPPPPSQTSTTDPQTGIAQFPLSEETKEPEPFVIVEEPPQFPGGEAALLAYVYKNIIYPENAKTNNIQGRVIVKFCVTSKGGVNQVSIMKAVDPELDAEAMRVVNTLPLFKPGKQGGKPVPVWYILPVMYQLK
jgi:TonB family protein